MGLASPSIAVAAVRRSSSSTLKGRNAGLADPDAPISLGPSSDLADDLEEELPKQ
jgi:hypothetical protein